jgi:hypothetical protein
LCEYEGCTNQAKKSGVCFKHRRASSLTKSSSNGGDDGGGGGGGVAKSSSSALPAVKTDDIDDDAPVVATNQDDAITTTAVTAADVPPPLAGIPPTMNEGEVAALPPLDDVPNGDNNTSIIDIPVDSIPILVQERAEEITT